MKISLVDLKEQYQTIQSEGEEAIQAVLKKTNFIQGEEVFLFEQEFSQYLNQAGYHKVNCVSCANGTDALILALKALALSSSDEVLLPSHTFFATAEAVLQVGAKPVFVDIDPSTLLLDLKQLEEKITSKTKAILAVHLYGQPCNMEALTALAKKYQLYLIEDAAQAQGASWKGKRIGTWGDMACFSFFPGKNLGAFGDAGAVVSSNPMWLEKIRMLANHGRKEKYVHHFVGYNSRLDTLQAAILRVKLKYLDSWNQKRKALAQFYLSELKEQNLLLPKIQTQAEMVWHQFVIQAKNRDLLFQEMRKNHIEVGIHYPIPCHLQPALAYLGYKRGDLPFTEEACQTILSLPIYPELPKENAKKVTYTLKEAIHSFSLVNVDTSE